MTSDYLNIILLAGIQGISEFLPISSSGHLVVLESLMNLGLQNSELFFFNLLVHVATLFATIWFYRKDIFLLIINASKELVWALGSKKLSSHLLQGEGADNNKASSPHTPHSVLHLNTLDTLSVDRHSFNSLTLVIMLAITTVITGIIGVLLKPLVSNFHNLGGIGIFFIINGGILLSGKLSPSRRYALAEKKMFSRIIKFAIIIGVVQGLAVFPGISRSGTTITTAILLGLADRDAMKYSIFASIPIIGGAFILELVEYIDILSSATTSRHINIIAYSLAVITSFVVGYCSLMLLYRLVKKQRIYLFSYYVFALGIALIGYQLLA